ncbi:hypothetical protein D3C87_2019780 [compost metagenome]
MQIMIVLAHDLFELVEFRVRKLGYLRLGKRAENEIHLANTAMPATIENTPAARVEVGARACQSGHVQIPVLRFI